MRATSVFFAISMMLVVMGCGVGRQLSASPSDASSYRETRIASSLDARMAASSEYLAAHPEGAFRDEVASFFERAEPLYFEARKSTIPGLRAYLDALPEGPHAAEARERLAILERREMR